MPEPMERHSVIQNYGTAVVRDSKGTTFIVLALNGREVGVLPLELARELAFGVAGACAIAPMTAQQLRGLADAISPIALVRTLPGAS